MAEKTPIRTLEQGRAKFAYECVNNLASREDIRTAIWSDLRQKKEHKDKTQEELAPEFDKSLKRLRSSYGGLVKRVPSLVQTNGLGQTLAFIKSKMKNKKSDEHDLLYEHIGGSLSQRELIDPNAELVEQVIKKDSAQYRHLTTETLAFLNWLKRFADGLIEKEK